MTRKTWLGMAAILLLSVTAAPQADAADVRAVLALCDRMAKESPGSCRYSSSKLGIDGCTTTVCWHCPRLRPCFAVRHPGSREAVPGNLLELMQNQTIERRRPPLCPRDESGLRKPCPTKPKLPIPPRDPRPY